MWTLKDDLAGLDDLDAQVNATAKVVDIMDELVAIVCPPWFTSGCLLMILTRVLMLHQIMSTSFSLFALSIHTVFKHKRCLEWV